MKKLKKQRIKCGLTSEQMAWNLKISVQTYYSYEQDRISPPLKRLKLMAIILKCKVDDII